MTAGVAGLGPRRARATGDAAPPGPGRRLAVLVVLALVATACRGAAAPDEEPGPRDEAVTVPAAGLELAGTLRLPDGDGPFPALVIAHGSGPLSRRGLAPGQLGFTLPQPVPVYEELAEGLRAAGYAVLTYDKRTCGPFNGCADNGYPSPPDDLTLEAFVADLDAVVDHLTARDDVAAAGVVGHSQGGTVAARLLDRRDDLDALVLLATPAVPLEELLATQADRLAELVAAVGQDAAAARQQVAELRELAAAVATVADGELEGGPVGGASRRFWASWIEASRDAPRTVQEAATPVLALGGGADWNVPPEQVEAWEPFLGPRDELRVLPEVTHALTRLEADDPAAITPADVGTEVEEELVTTLVTWLEQTLGE